MSEKSESIPSWIKAQYGAIISSLEELYSPSEVKVASQQWGTAGESRAWTAQNDIQREHGTVSNRHRKRRKCNKRETIRRFTITESANTNVTHFNCALD